MFNYESTILDSSQQLLIKRKSDLKLKTKMIKLEKDSSSTFIKQSLLSPIKILKLLQNCCSIDYIPCITFDCSLAKESFCSKNLIEYNEIKASTSEFFTTFSILSTSKLNCKKLKDSINVKKNSDNYCNFQESNFINCQRLNQNLTKLKRHNSSFAKLNQNNNSIDENRTLTNDIIEELLPSSSSATKNPKKIRNALNIYFIIMVWILIFLLSKNTQRILQNILAFNCIGLAFANSNNIDNISNVNIDYNFNTLNNNNLSEIMSGTFIIFLYEKIFCITNVIN